MNVESSSLINALNPNAIAIVGASSAPEKRGYQLVKTLVSAKKSGSYKGEIYPINPKLETLLDVVCYADIENLPTVPELAIICTPAFTVPDIVKQCGEKGIAMAVVLAAGFAEVDEGGAKLEEEILENAKATGIRVLGPNISGLFLQHGEINLVGFQGLRKGGTSILSQSGNVALELVTQATKENQFGFNQYFGIGNQMDIEFADLLDCLIEDNQTEAAVAYIEGFKNAPGFLQSAHAFAQKKPLVLYKAGRSEVSQQAAKSHTGALAGNFRVTKDLLDAAGVTLVDRIDDLLPVANTLSKQQILPSGRVLVLTDGGGHGTIAADLLDEAKITLAALSADEKLELNKRFPGLSVGNPMDLAGIADQNPKLFAELIQFLLASDNIDGLIWVGLFGGYHIRFDASLLDSELQAVDRIIELQQSYSKPILLHSVYRVQESPVLQKWAEAGLTLFGTIDAAVRIKKALIDRAIKLQIADKEQSEGLACDYSVLVNWQAQRNLQTSAASRLLTESEARALLGSGRVALEPHYQVSNTQELEEIAHLFNDKNKYAMKIVSPDIAHKSDVGGVALNVQGMDRARAAFAQIMNNCAVACPAAKLDGVLISPMSPQGAEYVVGYQQDPQFGPIIMFGLGGVFVELFQDIHFSALPLSEKRAAALIDKLKHREFVDGFRHLPPLNKAAMVKLLTSVSEFVLSNPQVKSMDLNPVIAHADGVTAVDVRIEVFE